MEHRLHGVVQEFMGISAPRPGVIQIRGELLGDFAYIV